MNSNDDCEYKNPCRNEWWFIIATLCLMAIVLIGGLFSLYRAGMEEAMVRETRDELQKVDVMLQKRTEMFEKLDNLGVGISKDIDNMLEDQNRRFERIEKNQHQIIEALKKQ